MRNILVLQHVPHEILGTLNPLLKKHGFRIRYVNFGRDPHAEPKLNGYNGLIILGGPMGVYQAEQFPHLKTEMRIIEEALEKNVPILGICLGSQLIAHVLGSPVRKHHENEIGWHRVHLTDAGAADPLFRDFERSEMIFQLHGDTFEIPRSADHLAFSELCPGQAFRYGEKVYGLQFHLEVDEPMVHRWLKVPETVKDLLQQAPVTAEEILEDTKRYIERSLALSERAFTQFVKLFNLKDRPVILGSDHGKPLKKS